MAWKLLDELVLSPLDDLQARLSRRSHTWTKQRLRVFMIADWFHKLFAAMPRGNEPPITSSKRHLQKEGAMEIGST